jgi:phosphate transport system permease protein
MADTSKAPSFPITKRRLRFFGLTSDELVQLFFRGNAMVSVLVLALITLFLFREGLEFFGQNQQNLQVYRRAGLDYVDHLRWQEQDHTALNRYLLDVRMKEMADLTGRGGLSVEAANQRLETFDQYSIRFDDAIAPLRDLVSELSETASAIKTKYYINEDKRTERRQLLAAGRPEDAARVEVIQVDFGRELEPILASREVYLQINRDLSRELQELAAAARAVSGVPVERMDRFGSLVAQYVSGFPQIEQRLATWDYREEVSLLRSFSAFIMGRQWLTASFWQDWYGVLPLFVGSLMVSLIALLTVGSASTASRAGQTPACASSTRAWPSAPDSSKSCRPSPLRSANAGARSKPGPSGEARRRVLAPSGKAFSARVSPRPRRLPHTMRSSISRSS